MQSDAGYLAATTSAALVDRSARGKIAVAGNDRLAYLHAMFTNDVAALQPGGGCYAAYLTPQGRMIADMRVLELGDMTLLELEASVVAAVLQKLDAFVFSEDVRFGDLTQAFGELTVVGPAAATVVSAVLERGGAGAGGGELEAWPEFRNERTTFNGEMVLVAASRELGQPGFDLYVDRAFVEPLADALAAAGAIPTSGETAEVLRVEAGRPAFGVDMDADTIPLEAGIEQRAISFTKGCYPGQEVIIRVVHRGHGRVARKLVRLRLDGDQVPARGDEVKSAEGGAAGRITSAVWSPLAGAPLALALVHRDFTEAGASLTVIHGGAAVNASVVKLEDMKI
jgi:tRNA-modifying protein YgfZ